MEGQNGDETKAKKEHPGAKIKLSKAESKEFYYINKQNEKKQKEIIDQKKNKRKEDKKIQKLNFYGEEELH